MYNNLIAPNKKNLTLAIIILLLVLGNIFFAAKYFFQYKEAAKLQQELKNQKTNEAVVNFLDLFIEKVLKSDKEVSFEDRLLLENAIRNTGDSDLLSKWEIFTEGTNEDEIQQGVKDLLEALVRKIVS